MLKHTSRLTSLLGISTPIIGAPMARAGGGKLARAISTGGGMGMVGGSYIDEPWLNEQLALAGDKAGCGFITWALEQKPHVLDEVLARGVSCVMLSFGAPLPWAKKVHEAGTVLMCQVQNLEHTRMALEAGAHIVVAQGSEAGGHGHLRSTFTFVPEVANLVAKENSEAIVVAAGGIVDGRGLAAALMLGAEGILMGTRFWLSKEALVAEGLQQAVLPTTGDETLRTHLFDVARRIKWPAPFTARGVRNPWVRTWENQPETLAAQAEEESVRYGEAANEGRADETGLLVGEAIGLINKVEPAADIIKQVMQEAETLLKNASL